MPGPEQTLSDAQTVHHLSGNVTEVINPNLKPECQSLDCCYHLALIKKMI